MLFEQYIAEKDAIEATQDQIRKAMKKADKYTNKAAAQNYDVKYKKDKLEYEKKKDALQRQHEAESDPVKKAQIGESIKDLEKKWSIEKGKYKERITMMKKGARINPAGGGA
jgi:hypothetical protein